MKKLKIAVFTENREYGLDLARGLCSQSSGIEVLVAEDESQALDYIGSNGVIVTDKYTHLTCQTLFLTKEKTENDSSTGSTKKICKISPVSKIWQEAVSICFENTGEIFSPELSSELRIWEFVSSWGGAGTTSIAMTCARLLAAETDKKVLYMNFGVRDDYKVYTDACFDKIHSKRKFIYASETGSRIMTDNCFAVDEYGVFYFKPEEELNSFLYEANMDKVFKLMERSRKFTHIIADSGKKSKAYLSDADLTFKIFSERDLRSSNKNSDRAIEIINFSNISGMRDGKFYIPLDEDGFIRKEEKIDISMSSRFAAMVVEILRYCLKGACNEF